ncbi:MAG: hypothetical protein U1E73_02970 [Planctomycetota bacterium]
MMNLFTSDVHLIVIRAELIANSELKRGVTLDSIVPRQTIASTYGMTCRCRHDSSDRAHACVRQVSDAVRREAERQVLAQPTSPRSMRSRRSRSLAECVTSSSSSFVGEDRILHACALPSSERFRRRIERGVFAALAEPRDSEEGR